MFNEQWGLVALPCGYLRPPGPFHTRMKIRSGDQRNYPSLKFSFVASASSAPSVGGSGAEYIGNLSPHLIIQVRSAKEIFSKLQAFQTL